MLKDKVYHSGNLWGGVYEYENVGDKVPTHSHPNLNDHHNVICLAGKVEIPEFSIVLNQGEMTEIDCFKDHTIIALEPNSKTLHLCINGKPKFAEYY